MFTSLKGGVVVALLVALAGQILYHVAQKNVASESHPVVALLVFYAVAMIGALPLFALFPMERSWIDEARRIDGWTVVVGLAIVLIELGFLLAYRAGAELSTAFVFTSAAVAASLVLVGNMRFGEALTWSKVAGIAFAISGIALLTKK